MDTIWLRDEIKESWSADFQLEFEGIYNQIGWMVLELQHILYVKDQK